LKPSPTHILAGEPQPYTSINMDAMLLRYQDLENAPRLTGVESVTGNNPPGDWVPFAPCFYLPKLTAA